MRIGGNTGQMTDLGESVNYMFFIELRRRSKNDLEKLLVNKLVVVSRRISGFPS